MYSLLNTLFVGKVYHQKEESSSTNDELAEMVQKYPKTEGMILQAVSQYRGRGQRGRHWISEKGLNLTFSVLLIPEFLRANEVFLLNQIASLAIHEALTKLTILKFSIKWPNDILYKGSKIAGILIENQLSGQKISQTIVGIGLNVNQMDFPPLDRPATSLSLISEKKWDLQYVMAEIAISLEKYYLMAKAGNYKPIRASYHHQLYLLEKEAKFQCGNHIIQGIIIGVSNEGLLRIKMANETKEFDIREVHFLE